MQKHTAGPWTFDQTWALINGPKGEEIAAIHAARRVNPQTAHANARLIAAAPALLEALESLRKEFRAHIKMDVRKHFSLMTADVAADKAIRAARGDD